MNNTPFILTAVVVVNLLIAGVVLLTNPVRTQNRTFFSFAVLLSLWAICVQLVITTDSLARADFFIRLSEYFGLLLPASFQALCLSMVSREADLRSILRGTRVNLVLSQVCGLVVFTPLFLRGVEWGGESSTAPLPVYGPAFAILQVYIVAAFLAVIVRFIRMAVSLDGIAKAELQFTLFGVAAGVGMASITNLFLPMIFPEHAPQQYGPLCIIPLNMIIAYGIATHRILDMSAFIQRATAYILLGVYLPGVYVAVKAGVAFGLKQFNQPYEFLSQFLAAIAVAFSVSPIRGILQQFSYKLFISRQTLTVHDVTKRGNEIFASISTTDAILERFFKILGEGGIDAQARAVLLPVREGFKAWADTTVSSPPGEDLLCLPAENTLIRELRSNHVPIAADTLRRMRPTPASRSVLRALDRLAFDLAIGIYFKDDLRGVVLLGPRKSGRIYSSSEQDALRVLCDQLAVALENANLYTEVQNNKIYNDILVDSLLSGVIAVSSDGYISVFNREAQRMTGLSAGTALGRAAEVLPDDLANVLRETLRTGRPARDQETVLRVEAGDDVPIRFGSSLFHGAQGDVLGALVVFSDLTARKKLEMQVRRSDRLASIGTLSAGMAHEIKNPLVTVKTFAELLPERYLDEDFRGTFSSLVSKEVQRIDSIVNQLLRFARPARADLRSVSLQQVLQGALELLQEQLRQKDIQPQVKLSASQDLVQADANLLEQAFINLLFNAIDAMGKGGTLTVTTSTTQPPWHLRQQYHIAPGSLYVRTTIRDTGCGIASPAIDCIFDPFFTTKEQGTGLGLSISHGIITEHEGLIDVESQLEVGTAFHIYIPLMQQEAVVS